MNKTVLIAHGETVNDTPVTIVDGHKVPQPAEVKQDFQPESEKDEKQLLLLLSEQVSGVVDMTLASGNALLILIQEVSDLKKEIAALKSKPFVDPSIHTVD